MSYEMDGWASSANSIGIDAIFQYTGTGAQLFSGIMFYIIIVRIFDSTSVGAIALFVAIIGLFNMIFTFGLNTAAQHFTSYSLGVGDYASLKRTVIKFIGYGLGFSSLSFFTLFFLSPLISIFLLHSANYSYLVRTLSIVLFGNVMFWILNGTILGIQRFRLSAIINIIIWVIYYFGALVLAIFYRSINLIIMGWIFGIFMGVIIELLFVLLAMKNFRVVGTAPSHKSVFTYSLPVLLSGLMSYGAAYADRFIVSGFLNLSYLGIYNFALLIATSIGFLAVPFNNILMPKFSEMYGQDRKYDIQQTVAASTTLLSSFYIPAATGIIALSPMILKMLGGSIYAQGALPLQIIMIFTSLFITQNIFVQAIASVRRTKLLIYSSLVGLSLNILISYLLIPKYGLVGAALGYSSVFASSFSILYFYGKRESLVRLDLFCHLKILFASFVMFSLIFSLRLFFGNDLIYLSIYIPTGFIVYITAARKIQVFKSENKELILSLFPENHVRIKRLISYFILY